MKRLLILSSLLLFCFAQQGFGQVTVSPPNAILCKGTPITLTANTVGAKAYKWSTGATTSSINVTPLVSTMYKVVVTYTSTKDSINVPVRVNQPNQNDIYTIVGQPDTSGYNGDGGLAMYATLYGPTRIAFDKSGNMYIVDNGNNVVRKVNAATGIITTIAGNGTAGYLGDGNAATTAELNGPIGVAVDGSGNVYIGDAGNNRVRMVSASSGNITTVAGVGFGGYNGDGGSATGAELTTPWGVAVDTIGDLFIADAGNNRVRMVNTSGIISTVAGNGYPGFSGDNGAATSAELNFPASVTIDPKGNLVIADSYNNRVRQVLGGKISTIAGNGTIGFSGDGGAATAAELNYPRSVAFDHTGHMYIADYNNNRIRIVYNPSGVIMTFAGNGTPAYLVNGGSALSAELKQPPGVEVNQNGDVFIADEGNFVVREVHSCASAPLVTINPAHDTICQGIGKAILTASGATTYTWAPPTGLSSTIGATVTATPTITTTYTVTGIDTLGSGIDSVTVVVSPKYTLSITPTSPAVCKGSSVTLTASSSLTPSYSWSPGSFLSSTNTSIVTATPAATITYTLTANDKGCIEKDSVQVKVNPDPVVSISPLATTICSGSSLVLKTSGAASYVWSTGATTSQINVTPTSKTTYTVTGTSSLGCTAQDTVTIEISSPMVFTLVPTDPTCNGGNNGSIVATVSGGSPPYTYSWSPTSATTSSISGLTAGKYTLTVTDSKGCIDTASQTLMQPPPITISFNSTNVLCFGGNTGSATAITSGGTAPYTYLWNPIGRKNDTADNLSAGIYTVTVTDNNGCSNAAKVTITEPTQLRDSINPIVNVACFSGNTGSATAAVKGGTAPYTYSWSNGQTTQMATNLTAGFYNVNIKDANGCAGISSVTINQPSQIRDSVVSQSNVPCYGGNSGSATIGFKGGTPGYTFAWSPSGGSSYNATGLTAGNYTVTVTDKSGCNSNVTVTITQPSALTIISPSDSTCTTGTLNATGKGGTTPYTYVWSSGLTTTTITGLSSGLYMVTVTDSNGCKVSKYDTVSNYPPLNLAVNSVTAGCPGTASNLGESISGGDRIYFYSWSPAKGLNCTTCPAPIANPAVTTTYTLTVVDGCGLIANGTVNVSFLAAPALSLCCDSTIFTGQSVSLSANASGTGNTFSWSPTANLSCNTCPNPIANPTETTTYVVTVSNPADPCPTKDSVVIQIGANTLIFYTGISPNGDGHNDTWIIDNIDAYPDNTAVIYNRWGTEVWRGTGYNNSSVVWKGFNQQGQPLPDGTYFYSVTINTKIYKGWVQLTR
ncbi:MAG TPA: gliding motility-associated C-terminal domain-containing protein [Bacteroidia bacterium]|nr:gliding motility-associated C-terminal domain-containing protein [Bacteroidia bacterium]